MLHVYYDNFQMWPHISHILYSEMVDVSTFGKRYDL